MSVSSVSQSQSAQNIYQPIKTGLRQLAANLKAGDLTQAQSNYATLSSDISASQLQSNTTLTDDLSALGAAIDAGNLTDAQAAFKTLAHDLRQVGRTRQHHQAPRDGGPLPVEIGDRPARGPIADAFKSLKTALKSGDINAAQEAYSTLQQVLSQYGLNADAVASNSEAAPTPGSNVNLSI